MSQARVPKIVVFGACNIDSVRIHPDLNDIPDGKDVAQHCYTATGGGGGNVILALQGLTQSFKMSADIELFTKIGKKQPNYLTRDEILHGLNGVPWHDMNASQEIQMPHHTAICWKAGRFLSKEFEAPRAPIDEEAKPKIVDAIQDADVIVLQTNFSRVANFVCENASENTKIIIDYSEKNPDKAKASFEPVIKRSDVILGPHDAIAPGMYGSAHHAEVLVEKLCEINKRGSFIAISDSNKPVLIHENGERQKDMTITPAERVVDAVGVGDVRTAAFAFFLAHGSEPRESLEKANAVARHAIAYPGRDWIAQLSDLRLAA